MATKKGSAYWKVQEIAERFDVSRKTVYNWIKSGKLNAGKLAGGKEYRISQDELIRFEKEEIDGGE